MTHDEILTKGERKHQVWLLKFEREYAALRSKLVEKYGEEGVRAVEDSCNKKYGQFVTK